MQCQWPIKYIHEILNGIQDHWPLKVFHPFILIYTMTTMARIFKYFLLILSTITNVKSSLNSTFSVLIKEFQIKHPIVFIDETILDKKDEKLTYLMKNLFMEGHMTWINKPKFRNWTYYQDSSAFLFGRYFFEDMPNPQKPWIYMDSNSSNFSRIDAHVYSLNENDYIFEKYNYKTLFKNRILGKISNGQFVWENDVERGFYERRGNFENLTLFAMTSDDMSNMIYHIPVGTKISNVVSDTYEVNVDLIWYFFSATVQKE